jgi:hypothetical protein
VGHSRKGESIVTANEKKETMFINIVKRIVFFSSRGKYHVYNDGRTHRRTIGPVVFEAHFYKCCCDVQIMTDVGIMYFWDGKCKQTDMPF